MVKAVHHYINANNSDMKLVSLCLAQKARSKSACSSNKITYSMFANFPKTVKLSLLEFYNRLWSQGRFLSKWQIAEVLPA
jgi:hypothetical protein